MGDGVMVQLSSGEEVCPFPRVVSAEDVKISFKSPDNLICSVCPLV